MLDTRIARNLSYALNRIITGGLGRGFVSDAIALCRPQTQPPEKGVLSYTGFCNIGSVLTAAQIADVQSALGDGPLIDPYKQDCPAFTLDRVPESIHLGQYRHDAIIRAPHLLQLANRPDVLATVSELTGGAKPTLQNMLVWWSFPVPGKPVDSQLWHRDCSDWAMPKLFVYLTDVDEGSGPHAYIPRSIHSDHLTKIRRYGDDEVARAFSTEPIVITGPAGTAFIEDARGMHRATPPTTRRRLVFEASYGMMGLTDKAFPAPYQKIRMTRAELGDLDPWINRFFVEVV